MWGGEEAWAPRLPYWYSHTCSLSRASESFLKNTYFYFMHVFIFACIYVHGQDCAIACVWGQGQHALAGSVMLPHPSLGSNSSCQSWHTLDSLSYIINSQFEILCIYFTFVFRFHVYITCLFVIEFYLCGCSGN